MTFIDDLIERSRLNFKDKALSIKIAENDEPLIGQSELEEMGFICQPFWKDERNIEGDAYKTYIAGHPDFNLQLRQSVVLRLEVAKKLLPENFTFVLKAGFRPYEVQMELLESLVVDSMRRHHEMDSTSALSHARQYVADPRLVCPPHTTGGAVDIDVIDTLSKERIDMGCPPNTDDERATLHSDAITSIQYKRRLTVLQVMLAVGFAPLHNEWWHFSYGETRWAAFYGQKHTLYGIKGSASNQNVDKS